MKRTVAVAAVLAGRLCLAAPLLQPPDRVESFCSEKEPRGTAIASILGSVSDRIETSVAYPGDATLRTDVKQNSGVIGALEIAAALHAVRPPQRSASRADYIDVTDVVIDNQLSGNRVAADLRDRRDAARAEELVLRASTRKTSASRDTQPVASALPRRSCAPGCRASCSTSRPVSTVQVSSTVKVRVLNRERQQQHRAGEQARAARR